MGSIRWGGAAIALIALGGCANHVSGAYLARGGQTPQSAWADLLQLTPSGDGHLMGTLTHVGIKPDGSLDRWTLNIQGSTDGRSITLAAQVNEPLATATNMSGQVTANGIALVEPGGTESFAPSTMDAYTAVVQAITTQAQQVQQQAAQATAQREAAQEAADQERAQQQAIADANSRADALATALSAYVAQVQARHDLGPFHAFHDKALAAARHDLDLERSLPANGPQRGQVSVRIHQIGVQVDQFDIPWSQSADRGKDHLAGFDAAIARSPCRTQPDLPACPKEHQAEGAYQAAKATVQGEIADITATIARDAAALTDLAHQSDAAD
ncbi:hypothetical protein [Dyella psychrodurans]|uniref:Lipoprotein n=1 Tax=Dyella psychrodurans TaxID=1927960 RepID=A0A370XC74_9GAMM|nr:hypothetical protein [Dyella psychrodurans]RDS85870.1 hypothetical protein DWU99_00930 [Dyella psychrodurans]